MKNDVLKDHIVKDFIVETVYVPYTKEHTWNRERFRKVKNKKHTKNYTVAVM